MPNGKQAKHAARRNKERQRLGLEGRINMLALRLWLWRGRFYATVGLVGAVLLVLSGCSTLNPVESLDKSGLTSQLATNEDVQDDDLIPANPNKVSGLAGFDEDHARRNGVSERQIGRVRELLQEQPLAIYKGVIVDRFVAKQTQGKLESRRPLVDVSAYTRPIDKVTPRPPVAEQSPNSRLGALRQEERSELSLKSLAATCAKLIG